MKKARAIITISGIAVISAAIGTGVFFYSTQDERLAEKTRELKELQETFVPMRFRVIERDDFGMTVEFRFYSLFIENIEDADMEILAEGKEVAPARTVDIKGTELFIDSVKIPNGERLPYPPEAVWAFPYRVFSDTIAPENAIPIYEWYDTDGFPAVYNALELDEADKTVLSEIYAGVTGADTGNALHDMNSAARFRLDVWYDLVVHVKKGGVEFIAE